MTENEFNRHPAERSLVCYIPPPPPRSHNIGVPFGP